MGKRAAEKDPSEDAAEKMFREDPSKRLLLSLGLVEIADRARRAEEALPGEALDIEGGLWRLEIARLGHPEAGEKAAGLWSLLREIGFADLKEPYAITHGRYWNAIPPERADHIKREAKRLCEGMPLHKAFAEAMGKCLEVRVPEARIEETLALGRERLLGLGASRDLLGAIEEDKDLAKALHRLAFRGGEKLSENIALGAFGLGALWEARRQWIHLKEAERSEMPKLLLPEGHPWEAVSMVAVGDIARLDYASKQEHQWIRPAIKALGASPERFRAARAALLEGTGTQAGREALWSEVPACGDWGVVASKGALEEKRESEAQGSVFARNARRVRGAKERGDDLGEALGNIGKILEWSSPRQVGVNAIRSLSYGSFGVGPKALEALALEAQEHERGSKEAAAAALSRIVSGKADKKKVCASLAERGARGFSEIGGDLGEESLLPGLAEALGEKPRTRKGFVAGEALRADPMGEVAAAAARRFGFPGRDDLGLVGEAKEALGSQAGLSAGGWRMLARNPDLAAAFAAAIDKPEVPEKDLSRKSAMAAAEEAMAISNARGEAFRGKLEEIMASESETAQAEAAGRALSACAMGGIEPEAAERMLSLIQRRKAAAGLLAGRIGDLPDSAGSAEEGFELEARALAMDAKALLERVPALIKGISDSLEREIGRRERAGEPKASAEESALQRAFAEIGDIQDVAKGSPPGFWSGLDRKDPWGDALRAHEAWVAQNRERRAQGDPSLSRSWEHALGRHGLGKAIAEELTTGLDLFEEGEFMRHCVASYAGRCESGASRIFSVRIDGARASTLELRPVDKAGQTLGSVDFASLSSRSKVEGWQIAQHRGKHNATNLPPAALEIALEIERLATERFRAETARMREEQKIARAAESKEKETQPRPLKKRIGA